MSPFLSLSRPTIIGLSEALMEKRVKLPINPVTLSGYTPESQVEKIAQELNQLHQQGMTEEHIAYILKLLAEERKYAQAKQDQIDLVWTGPELGGSESRDTSIVVREMFSSAHHTVLISSYAIDTGPKAQELFAPLAKKMDDNPNLQVRMFLNIQRRYKDSTPSSVLLRQFTENFRNRVWLGKRLPEVFHDPRSLELSNTATALPILVKHNYNMNY